MNSHQITQYLRGMDQIARLPNEAAITLMLEASLMLLCEIQDYCEDPWHCPLRHSCPRAAGIVKAHEKTPQ